MTSDARRRRLATVCLVLTLAVPSAAELLAAGIDAMLERFGLSVQSTEALRGE